jgi:hypothetical protein
MKKIVLMLSFTLIALSSCSSDSNNSSDDNTLLMRKWYDNSNPCSNGNREYYEFSAPNIYKHYVPGFFANDCSYFLAEYGTWSRNGITIVIKYDQSLAIGDDILTIDELSATTFSFVWDGGGYSVLSSY